MRPKSIILLILALTCGVVASVGVSQVIERNRQAADPNETSPVLVASREISNSEFLSSSNVKVEQWPKDKLPPQPVLTSLEEIKGLRARVITYEGEAILAAKTLKAGEVVSPSDSIPKGYRVASVQVDDVSGDGHLIRPGDRVDVMVYVNKEVHHQVPETGTFTILQDIQVFAVDQNVRRIGEKEDQAVKAKTVSLLVKPEQGQKVALASEIGRVRLVLRRPDDTIDQDNKTATLPSLFGADNKVAKGDREDEEKDIKRETASQRGFDEVTLKKLAAAPPASPATPAVDKSPALAMTPDQPFTMQVLVGPETRNVEFAGKMDGSRHQSANTLIPSQVESVSVPTGGRN